MGAEAKKDEHKQTGPALIPMPPEELAARPPSRPISGWFDVRLNYCPSEARSQMGPSGARTGWPAALKVRPLVSRRLCLKAASSRLGLGLTKKNGPPNSIRSSSGHFLIRATKRTGHTTRAGQWDDKFFMPLARVAGMRPVGFVIPAPDEELAASPVRRRPPDETAGLDYQLGSRVSELGRRPLQT